MVAAMFEAALPGPVQHSRPGPPNAEAHPFRGGVSFANEPLDLLLAKRGEGGEVVRPHQVATDGAFRIQTMSPWAIHFPYVQSQYTPGPRFPGNRIPWYGLRLRR